MQIPDGICVIFFKLEVNRRIPVEEVSQTGTEINVVGDAWQLNGGRGHT